MTDSQPIIDIKDLKTYLGGTWVHKGIDLSITRSEIVVIIGGSGSGKTVLLREMLNLNKPTSGSIRIFNHELTRATPAVLMSIQQRWGVLFQSNALFSSLTLLENVAFPLKEHSSLDSDTIEKLALLKILLAGLSIDAIHKYPAELSGGMQKRAALARAIVLDPELLFLDEPTAGLDPANVLAFDNLILGLQATMGLTIVMVTHDINSLRRIANKVVFLGEGKVLCMGTVAEVMKDPHPLIQQFFNIK